MTDAPLLDRIADHERLMDWWADFLAKCAERQSRRINVLSARSLKSAHTRRLNEMKGVNRGSLAPAFADDWDQCPRCQFITVACDCGASQGEKQ